MSDLERLDEALEQFDNEHALQPSASIRALYKERCEQGPRVSRKDPHVALLQAEVVR